MSIHFSHISRLKDQAVTPWFDNDDRLERSSYLAPFKIESKGQVSITALAIQDRDI